MVETLIVEFTVKVLAYNAEVLTDVSAYNVLATMVLPDKLVKLMVDAFKVDTSIPELTNNVLVTNADVLIDVLASNVLMTNVLPFI